MIRQFLENCGFEHKQGSGYLSAEPISLNQTIVIYQAMTEEMPWLDSCSKTMDVGNVRGFYNLKTLSQNLVADNAVDNSQLELADFDRAFPTVDISHDESMPRRYLMFDLDSASLKKEFGPTRYTLAYSDLREALENRGFEHRQGSGYLSKAPISKNKLIVLYDSLVEELPWLNTCSTAMHFADIGKTFNLKTLARNSSASISDVEFFRNQGTQKRTSRASAESKPSQLMPPEKTTSFNLRLVKMAKIFPLRKELLLPLNRRNTLLWQMPSMLLRKATCIVTKLHGS